jgi:hypothetical protein
MMAATDVTEIRTLSARLAACRADPRRPVEVRIPDKAVLTRYAGFSDGESAAAYGAVPLFLDPSVPDGCIRIARADGTADTVDHNGDVIATEAADGQR